MSFFLGIDLGTTYFKAGIFDETGKLHGLGRCLVEKDIQTGNVCELQVAIFWKILCLCIQEAISKADISSKQICGLSYSSQANSFILLDESDTPLTPLILWTDERVKDKSIRLHTLTTIPDFIHKTGLGIFPDNHSLIAKIEWFQKWQDPIWKRVRSIMSISDYLTFILTGERISDISTSSMTGLLNVQENRWWQKAMDYFNIEEKQLSTLIKVGSRVGNITKKGAEFIGLSPVTIMFLGGLDHHMVAIGAGIPNLKYISESTGTVLACVNYQNGYEPREGVNISQGLDNNHYFQMAFNTNGAATLDWYQSSYAPNLSISKLLALAKAVTPGSEGLIAKPSAHDYSGLEGFIGMKDSHTHAHFVRAILESTGLSLRRLIKDLDGVDEPVIVPSGGGARSREWIQIKSNMLNRNFLIPESSELACKGAALLCSLGVAYIQNIDEFIENQMRYKEIITPDPVETEKYVRWYNNIKR